MEKMIYNPITDKNYLDVVTILDYEVSAQKCLSNFCVSTQNRDERKIIVDLALKVGMNKYRFVACDVTDDGKVLWNSSKYVTPCDDITKQANFFIKQNKDILLNSMLPSNTQESLLHS